MSNSSLFKQIVIKVAINIQEIQDIILFNKTTNAGTVRPQEQWDRNMKW